MSISKPVKPAPSQAWPDPCVALPMVNAMVLYRFGFDMHNIHTIQLVIVNMQKNNSAGKLAQPGKNSPKCGKTCR
jgi:hypothetical protein